MTGIIAKHYKHLALITMFVLAAFITAFCLTAPAFGDELSETKAQLNAQVEKLDELTAKIEELTSQIDAKAEEATQLERAILEKQETISGLTRFFYKNPSANLLEYMLSAESLSEAITRAEFLYGYTEDLTRATKEQRELDATLHEEMDDIAAQKDEQVAAQEELQAVVSDLKAKVDELTAEQLSKLAAGSAFVTDFEDGVGEWHSGTASAYGGITDPGCGTVTALGTIVTEYSMGVAVPMSMPNYRSYLGRKVEISYGGKSVIAVVQDCGSMGGGSRVLDLQPGVFRAFGANSCNGWGLRTVQYRFF